MDRSKGLKHRAKRSWRVYVTSLHGTTLDRTLTALAIFSGLVLLVHDLFFAGWPELFIWGGELWDLLYQLCLAFAASFIFYFVVVHIRRQRDEENIRPFLSEKTERICEDAKQLIGGLRGGSVMKCDPNYYPTYEEVKKLCEHIRVDDPAPLIDVDDLAALLDDPAALVSRGKHVTWRQFICGH